MKLETKDIPIPGESPWTLFHLENNQGMVVQLLNYGGIITNLSVPDRNGERSNVVLGYDNYEEYKENPGFLGALIGRVAGRIRNARFQIEGQEYQVEANEEPHHLHGGEHGFHQVLWEASPFEREGEIGVKLSHKSPDGEGGYPGTLNVDVSYILTNDNELVIDYLAETDQKTIVTLTNHSYFNLSGMIDQTVHDHTLFLDSSCFAELDQQLIPTGEWADVTGTSFDYRQKRKLSESFSFDTPHQQVANGGIDHFFLLNRKGKPAIKLEDTRSGRTLEVETDQPGAVIYTSNNLSEGKKLLEGKTRKHAGICIETQSSPASLHDRGFPEIILTPDEPYHKRTVFTFGIQK
ncbi:aldose 1-epimerase [Thalassobacillus cyri]|uniref:Aldose 1-epimerase n=1 Tax=Thalassobacillus cyri TaxID=571932 RepID=A0A1H4ACN0_9BACI|nr:aldose epimerase family protein [Thalassobacillus cyri]SEA33660.1 aldose 1-epimerase [Thalassobacillus cyri]